VSDARVREFNELKQEMRELKSQVRKLDSKLKEHEREWVKDFLEKLE